MRNEKFWYFIFFLLIAPVIAFTQDYSNKGKDFWIGYGNHVRMFDNVNDAEQMQVYITSDVNTTGSVDIPGIGFQTTFSVTANQVTTIDIPRTAALFDEGLYNTGIHITAGLPVVVYSFIYVNAISGATLCLPTNVLGREYYSVNFTQISNEADCYSYFFVVATEDNTVVEITPSAATKGGRLANVPFTITMNKGEIYQVLGAATTRLTGADLTGSSIRSINTGGGCKRIGVFCGSGKISIGCGGIGTSDNLYQQIYPNSSWGKKYITVPTTNDGNNYQVNFYRIIRPNPASIVKLNGVVIPQAAFTNNFYYEFSNNTTNIIESDKAIFLAQYLTTSTPGANANCGNNGIGDPDMIFINPLEQTINRVTLNSMQPSFNTNLTTHFINVVIQNNPAAINTFQIDGVSKSSAFMRVNQDNSYAYARINVSKGAHTITCDSGFNAIAYGLGKNESYGYSAGANLRDLYQYIIIENVFTVANVPATCKNSPFGLSIVLPYKPLSLSWEFNGLLKDTLINAPVPDSIWEINGRILYKFRLTKTYQIDQTGNFPIKVMAENPNSDGCNGKQEIDIDLQVYNRPVAAFDTSFTGCLYDPILFLDKTITGRPDVKWNWQLGDGTLSNTKNVSHNYARAGIYQVTFSSVNDLGCKSDTIQRAIKIDELPVASYKIPPLNCGSDAVFFTNQSTLPPGVPSLFYWDFGDGVTTTSNSLPGISHIYTAEKTYSTSMYVATEKGCKSKVVILPITINFKPVVDFILPEICINDVYADFTNGSVIGDGNQSQLIYLWNFGDAANSNPANPNISVTKNGRHAYTKAANYTVSLKVTSREGCESSVTKLFTVNGAIPKANFIIDDAGNLCSNQAVTITDASTVDFGNITKVETYWNFANDPSKVVIDNEPSPGKKYAFNYADFGSPSSKIYQVSYVVYSGISCKSTISKTLNLLASPQLSFNVPAPVCAEVPSFQLTTASETAGLPGVGLYTGNGVTSAGYFTPSQSLAGSVKLTYTFTASNSCRADISQIIIVNPTPKVDAGPDRLLLEGEPIMINANASGKGLTYLWSPPSDITPVQSLRPSVSATEDRVYTIKATSSDGCTASDQLLVTVLKIVKVPNAFTPNGDNINDTWQIKFLATYPGCEVDVFNRYGQPVYHSTGYLTPWNGTYNGQPLPGGTYYYIIKPKNGRVPMNGSVTIIR